MLVAVVVVVCCWLLSLSYFNDDDTNMRDYGSIGIDSHSPCKTDFARNLSTIVVVSSSSIVIPRTAAF